MNLVITRTKGYVFLLLLTLCCSIIAMQERDKGKEKVPPIRHMPSSLRTHKTVARPRRKSEIKTVSNKNTKDTQEWLKLFKKHRRLDLVLLGITTPEEYEKKIATKEKKRVNNNPGNW